MDTPAESLPLLPIMLPSVPFTELEKLPMMSGIYFALTSSGFVLYIGVSFNLFERWKQHRQIPALKTMACTMIAYHLCPVGRLNALEQAMTTQFAPPLNGPWKPWNPHVQRIPLSDRFWAQVNKETCLGNICGCQKGIGHCWPWMGYHPPGRYGKINVWVDGQWKKHGTNRVAFELSKGPIPHGHFACHFCDNPPCCRPEHLWAGTVAENTRDAYLKGRLLVPSGIGENHYMHRSPEKLSTWRLAKRATSRLTDAQVETMLALIGTMPYTAIGAQFGISAAYVCTIYRGKRRKKLK